MKGQLWGGPHDGERLSLSVQRQVVLRPLRLPARDALGVTGPMPPIPRPVPVARYLWDGTSRWIYDGME